MATTIYDLARATGVSITTVSHALSGRGRVASSTRQRVLKAARDLGYAANPHARGLVSGRSATVALQISGFNVESASPLLPDAAYFMDVMNGAAAAAAARDYAVVLVPYDIEPERLQSFAVDGAIIVDVVGDEESARLLHSASRPIVTTGRPTHGPTRFPWVDNNHGHTARRMLDHLVETGYAQPALITTPTTHSYVADIHNAYVEWARDRGIRPRVVQVRGAPTEKAGARAARQLLESGDPPDSMYTSYDRLAVGALTAAERLGVDVPAELGLASAVDGDLLSSVTPTITSVTLNARRIGQEAANLLVRLIEEEPAEAHIVIPTRIVKRGSTAGTSAATGSAARTKRAA